MVTKKSRNANSQFPKERQWELFGGKKGKTDAVIN